ncbi:hypothetical protein HGH93_16995 [Chitinophaga polysaccharea]|uniref:hypothetical protein n=1 Tax=Chitinophaga TaxID=79328 RepID=UPI00145527C8|nr:MULTISPECIES: hypothetical protein [Chitinophaga]NLR59810.1 hypothetical protein [Chitinophaga polysaccharea]NLU96451.1 hypothetical protein [Chitinophaga sp. Ak27]
MKRCWILIGSILLSTYVGAQTFTLKPVKLLPAFKKPLLLTAPTPAPPTYPVYMLAPNAYYQQHFGFFCKQEWTWQKHTGLPVKLRLGDYGYTQRLEGKH